MSREFHGTVMTECPQWRYGGGGYRRVFADDTCHYLVDVVGDTITAVNLDTDLPIDCDPPTYRPPESLWTSARDLATALAGLGTVRRFRNPGWWNAIGVAIIRQVPRAAQVRQLCEAFAAAHGRRLTLPDGTEYALFPDAETVAALPERGFADVGLGFRSELLGTAARAYLDNSARWRRLSPGALVDELRRVDGLGAWSAHVAVTDIHGDFGYYPYTDLAIQTWARKAAPRMSWPDDEPTFTRMWKHLADGELSGLTATILAWGATHRIR